ncbi:hypothetical protein SteCoe_291 [Stentor coeruleus]|uniref:Uncharacterized protein n=1 Tax=Stentor coeruleus TaxID=5963 RepID=A0A1R2D4C6_9CILI|nr:hypothetical protein SteCoe_291 [Stentor coeruleus]
MDTAEYPHSEISFAITELMRRNIITIEEHTYLNKLLQDENEELLKIESTIRTLEERQHELIKIARLWQKPSMVMVPQHIHPDDTSSPLGTFLHEKKKRQHAENELKLSLATSDIQIIAETHEDN